MRREAAHASPTFFPAEFVGALTRRVQVGWIVGNLSIRLGIASPEASLATPRLAGLKTQTGQRFRTLSQPLPAQPSLQSTHIHSLCLSPLVCILIAAGLRTSASQHKVTCWGNPAVGDCGRAGVHCRARRNLILYHTDIDVASVRANKKETVLSIRGVL